MLFKTLPFVAASSLMSIATLTLPAAVAQRIADNVPEGITSSQRFGPRGILHRRSTITVQLQLQNKAAFDKAVDALPIPPLPPFTIGLRSKI